ncbi:52 kDa repressor of the inhibitor of the protein kinase-like [Hydra vulgaris]|uniref:52 kDa repressor of the inhibitor of the protein kinase-like n=1 Tax=Hydra vulgaris TaxID=6087 RepID=A0ABM4CB15_HYDVU
MCKLFSINVQAFSKGFSDWKHGEKYVILHENSTPHKNAVINWTTRKERKNTIDKQLMQELEQESDKFYKILKRVVAVVKFLSERGLAFRGHNETFSGPNNGNFMGCLELIAEFDPFLKEHMQKCSGKKHSVSYLTKTVYEEIITLMAKKVTKTIIEEVNSTKYYSIVVDSTPDVAHVDQLAIILRYCYQGDVFKRFLTITPITSHTGKSLLNVVKTILDTNNLSIKNCRGQSYDNAANMSGQYNGLRELLQRENQLAVYTPCAAHNLNLIGIEVAKVVHEVVIFFGTIQQLFVFFLSSTKKWNAITDALKLNEKTHTLKNLGKTRWCSHYEAVKALKNNYEEILMVLKSIANDDQEKMDQREEAKTLFSKMTSLENGILVNFWEQVLERINKVNKKLQTAGLDLLDASTLLSSLEGFIKEKRNNINTELTQYEILAKTLTNYLSSEYKDKRKRILRYSDGTTGCGSNLTGKNKFKIEILNVVLDKFQNEFQKRKKIYKENSESSMQNACKFYKEDIEDFATLKNECIHFKEYINIIVVNEQSQINCAEILKIIYDKHLIDTFPNLYTVMNIFLTMPITNCEAERSFSRMSYIKNKQRNTMSDDRLADLMLLSIEHKITKSLNYDEVIKEYALIKVRKLRH